ncbi:uncharacterized protein STEHIDRAFT_161731 [Stereum hirsutum FP-91666 SS1]|uniref:uncharacterized protein n=1 Tax=Stereum hirsutum (strain FP-91666) TaxID=721885 RepID=UPI000444A8A1|nr:uncharacterized protein STEHIDRAFT_161731 [Stereum hirsutum FP-91666 SS1]EIM81547.1 hypothetical protein STEHIDRAFT_161731 [Stereum hirsutum FP-91666 SS1]
MSTVNSITKKKVGLFAIQDTGAPGGRSDYKTLVIVHGTASPGDIFYRLLPFAPHYNTRIILVNRRDYPGSTPLTDSERQLLASALSDTAEAAENIRSYMKDRARELYDFLCEFAISEDIPKISGQRGITLVGWSLGATFVTALLAHLETFEGDQLTLRAYLNKFILLDPSYGVLGFPHHESVRMPIEDPTFTGASEEVVAWITGYYDHSLPPSYPSTPLTDPKLELSHTPLASPPPTITAIPPEELQTVFYAPPAMPDGSDMMLYTAGQQLGLFEDMRRKAIYVTSSEDVTVEGKKWRESVDVRVIWCDRTVWGMPWGIPKLYREIEDAKARKELRVGKVSLVRMRGSNHYVHWDEPERTLRALLAEDGAQEA